MKVLVPAPALLVACAALAAPPGALDDGTDYGIQRCEEDNGNAIYTDRTCASFDARRTPMSSELLTRIAMADVPAPPTNAAFSADAAIEEASPTIYRDASEPVPEAAIGRRPAADGCARSPQQLSMDLIGSFAMRSVNRLAESYYWAGMSHRQALPVMKQLERLSRQPLADARFLAAWIGPGDLTPQQVPDDAGLMQLVFGGDDARMVAVEVHKYSGCYFISF